MSLRDRVIGVIHAAETIRHLPDRLADAIAPPIGLPIVTDRPRAICTDEDHDDPEGPCPSCGQGKRIR
jgi:hypothetical protein